LRFGPTGQYAIQVGGRQAIPPRLADKQAGGEMPNAACPTDRPGLALANGESASVIGSQTPLNVCELIAAGEPGTL